MLNYDHVPIHYMISGLKNYVEDGVRPGSFLTAVLENDLKGAVGNADSNNLQLLPKWVEFCYSELPAEIWGSKEKVAAHLQSFNSAV